MSNSLRLGVGWSTHFRRPGLRGRMYRKLRYTYRAPAFLAEAMIANGHALGFMHFDEALPVDKLDGTVSSLAESVDLFYVSSHGQYTSASRYQLVLHANDWPVTGASLGNGGPSVAAFDTCDLIDLTDPAWKTPWLSPGSSLRLLLGFASPATVAENSTRRGQTFAAEILADNPIGPSWLYAVHQTGYAGTDIGVAVAFGDDSADADWALHDLKLTDLPALRSSTTPKIEVETCH
jgi:Family of unknown function (DUF6345)